MPSLWPPTVADSHSGIKYWCMPTKGSLRFLVNLRDLLTLQKKPEISGPYDIIHISHVTFDESTGKYTGLPKEWIRHLASTPEPKPEVPGEGALEPQPPATPPKDKSPASSPDLSPLVPVVRQGQVTPGDL